MSRVMGRLEASGGGALAAEAGLEAGAARAARLAIGALLALIAALALTTHPFTTAPGVPRAGVRPQPSHTSIQMPIGLATTASASIGASEPRFWTVRHGDSLQATGGGIHSTFSAAGAKFRVARGTLEMSLAGIGHGRSLGAVSAVPPTGSANRTIYSHGSISEFYNNGPYGLEQGFTVARPQRASGSLTLALGISGSLTPRQSGAQILFETSTGETALSYSQLRVTDATGRRLPARMSLSGRTVRLELDTHGARYPLQIDPFIQQGEKFNGTGATTEPHFGFAAALSADGSTALVSAREDNGERGAVWVFTRSGETWTQQGPKLTGSEEVDTTPSHVLFGESVALSADGNTALIGGRNDNTQRGAAWVFTRSGSTWSQQGPKLTGGSEELASGMFGETVALSADGNTALIGGFGDGAEAHGPGLWGEGAAWVFTRSGSTWTQQGPKLRPTGEIKSGTYTGGEFGGSVALSSDGDTALVSAVGDNYWVGAAWVFTRSGETWTQQGEKLTGSGEVGEGEFGSSVALSADGSTALVGGPGDTAEAGAAWAFTRSGETWTQQGEKLTDGEAGEGWFGLSVALSGDGNTALVGAPHTGGVTGSAWVFKRSGEVWIEPGEKLTGGGESGEGWFGRATALSTDGEIALVTGTMDNTGAGATWAFKDPPAAAPPIVKGVSVKKGPASGGTAVTITGVIFEDVTSVKFGSVEAASYEVHSANSITAITPEAPPGKVAMTVSNTDGASAPSKKAFFTFKKVKKPKK